MSGLEALVLIGGGQPSAPLTWARVGADGATRAHGVCNPGETLPHAAPGRTILVLPGADVQVKQLDLPARTEAQARAAAPLLFQSTLAAGEGVHYAIGPAQNAEGRRLVAAIAEVRLQEWLDRCRAARAEPEFVAVDFTLWPAPSGEVHVVETDDRVIVAAGDAGGFSIEPELAPSLFQRWLASLHDRPRAIVVAEGGRAQSWAHAPGIALRTMPPPEVGAALARAAIDPPPYAPNLRASGASRAERSQPRWRVWRFAAALALAAVLLQIGALVGEGLRDRRAAAATLAQAEAEFRAARPDVRRVVNLRAQANALVNAMEQAENHPVLSATEPLIQALQAQPLARLDELRFQAPSRSVRLRISASQPAALEAMMAALREQGLSVEARTLQPVDGRYVSELVIEAPI